MTRPGWKLCGLWQETYPETAKKVNVILAELPGLGLLDLLDGMEAAILVDAVHGRPPAGTLHHIRPEKLNSFTPGSSLPPMGGAWPKHWN